MKNTPQQHNGPPQTILRIFAVLLIAGMLWFAAGKISGSGAVRSAFAASDPVIAAAGDIACDPTDSGYNSGNGSATHCRQKFTSDLLINAGLSAVLDLGDNQYYCGGYQAFMQVYDLTWGRVKAITHPAVGNHEYLTSGGTGCDNTNANAAGYFQYFGAAAGSADKGYYSYDIGAWHIIALNSNCGNVGGCASGSPQYQWLQSDLAAHNNVCTLAYWHIPYFSSGGHAAPNTKAFWQLLYDNNADVILDGHDHLYERFAPQSPTGTADPARGIRQFTVGTGGANHNPIVSLAANSQVINTDTFGVLKLTLHSISYDWQFVPESGKIFTDSGTTLCHGNPVPTPTPVASASFLDQADTYVNASFPTTNYGTLATLRADASPAVHSYLRFTVSGLGGQPITRARLMLYANSSTSSGISTLAVASNSWSETGMTYNTAPALGNTLAISGAVATGMWISLDVTSFVIGEGTYSFAVTTPGSTAVSFQSREASSNRPQLLVDLGSAATPTSGPSATPTRLPTATSTRGAATPTNTRPPTATTAPAATATSASSVTLIPAADAYVRADFPTTNYGTLTTLRADGSPDVHSYIRFNVQGLGGLSIQRVRLRLLMNSSGSSGLAVAAVSDNTWGETTLTYSSAPALGSALANSGAVTAGTWVTLDVTSYVTSEGTYSFCVTTPGSTAISFAARESGANAPQLIIDLGP